MVAAAQGDPVLARERADEAARIFRTSGMGCHIQQCKAFLQEPGIFGRHGIDRVGRERPLIIEEYDCTTIVPPGWRVRRDVWDVLVLEADQD
jgi:hypothetical protein